MAEIRILRERVVEAPPDLVYDCIADYTNHHGNILPKEFSDLKVESGPGRGQGTRISFKMTMGGQTRSALADITEPEPGRVLVESDPNTGIKTVFTVEPANGGSRVRFDTSWRPRGFQGLIERLMARRLLEPVYDRELEQLERYARSRMAAGQGQVS
ncbi:MAG TPA: SRPBCC family protein [Dehalococcoidia bacterium]|nr:SRPBCC family protein [Dehalococcoidia bacterium]